jgi:hypothetical protein
VFAAEFLLCAQVQAVGEVPNIFPRRSKSRPIPYLAIPEVFVMDRGPVPFGSLSLPIVKAHTNCANSGREIFALPIMTRKYRHPLASDRFEDEHIAARLGEGEPGSAAGKAITFFWGRSLGRQHWSIDLGSVRCLHYLFTFKQIDFKARLVLVENGKRQPTVFRGASHVTDSSRCSSVRNAELY